MMIDYANAMSLSSKHFYQYGTKKVEYNLIRTKRRKTSEIIVDEKEITVRVPFDKPIYEIEKLLSSKIRWILEKQDQYKQREEIVQIANSTFLQNSTLPYLGQNYKINVIYENDKNYFLDNRNDKDKIEFKNDTFVITFYKEKNTARNYSSKLKEQIKIMYNKWIEKQADNIFIHKIKRYSREIGVSPQSYRIKFLKNRWGSLTKKGAIVLNANLVKAPEEIIDYIIIHELCHLKIQGHSHHFWRFLKQFEPDYEKKIKWLELNSKNILAS